MKTFGGRLYLPNNDAFLLLLSNAIRSVPLKKVCLKNNVEKDDKVIISCASRMHKNTHTL